MKTILIAIAILYSIHLSAQSNFIVFNEESILINGVNTNVENVVLEGNIDDIKKSWKSFTKETLDEKMSEKNNLLTGEKIAINKVTDKRGDLLAYFYNKDKDVSVNIAFRLGYDIYLNSPQYPEEYARFKEFCQAFVYKYYGEYLPKLIKAKSKEQKALTKELKTLKKGISKADKNLNKQNRLIIKSNKKIKQAESALLDIGADTIKKIKTESQITELKAAIITSSQAIGMLKESICTNSELVTAMEPNLVIIADELKSLQMKLKEVQAKGKAIQ